jgi:hypothetical protein
LKRKNFLGAIIQRKAVLDRQGMTFHLIFLSVK